MYDKQFWNSKLGQAAIASVLAMTAMIAITTQFQSMPPVYATVADAIFVLLA